MRFHRFESLEEYLPSGHQGVVNRLLVGGGHGVEEVSVWHGRLKPGGRSELHIHQSSRQVYIGVSGELTVGDGESEEVLLPMSTAIFDAGSEHFIENRSDNEAEVLVISVPGLK